MNDREPFHITLRQILEEQEISQRELVRRVQSAKPTWGSIFSINALFHGELKPTKKAMENIARALAIRPEAFAEYELLVAREKLDPEAVGFRLAVKNLERLRRPLRNLEAG